MRKACIDIGTNSALLLVAEKHEQNWSVLYDDAKIIRLGEGMKVSDGGARFLPEALERLDQCLGDFCQSISKYSPDEVNCYATAAARKAENKEDLLAIFSKHDLSLDIITGEKEAELTYLGANFQTNIEDYSVIDIGGGSTEILWKEENQLVGKSLPVGAVVLKESFFLADTYQEAEIRLAKDYILKQLNTLPKTESIHRLIAVAGTPTTLVMCEKGLSQYEREKIHGAVLNQKDIEKWLQKFNTTQEDRYKIVGLEAKRADIIFAGTLILLETMRYLNIDTVLVSVGGLRYGGLLK
tara:strand:- start:1768 stop:2658 length:891 start_codon:yes stop_codon:yes gene_type:complete